MKTAGHCKNFRSDHGKFKIAEMMLRIIGDTHGLIDRCIFKAKEPEKGLFQTDWYQGPGMPKVRDARGPRFTTIHSRPSA